MNTLTAYYIKVILAIIEAPIGNRINTLLGFGTPHLKSPGIFLSFC